MIREKNVVEIMGYLIELDRRVEKKYYESPSDINNLMNIKSDMMKAADNLSKYPDEDINEAFRRKKIMNQEQSV